MPDPAKSAAAELVQYVAEVCKPWTEFYGHEEAFEGIIRKHFPLENPWKGHMSVEEFQEQERRRATERD